MVGKKLIASAIGAVLGICVFTTQAAITELSTYMDPDNIATSVVVGEGNDSFSTDVAYPGSNPWTVSVANAPIPGGPYSILSITGRHNIEPCVDPSLSVPGLVFNTSFVVAGGNSYPSVQPGFAQGASYVHDPLGHQDVWLAIVSPYDSGQGNQKLYRVDVTGDHIIPEPHQYALMAGLGLLAFGFYRRVRG